MPHGNIAASVLLCSHHHLCIMLTAGHEGYTGGGWKFQYKVLQVYIFWVKAMDLTKILRSHSNGCNHEPTKESLFHNIGLEIKEKREKKEKIT
jgi:hypothetical protein